MKPALFATMALVIMSACQTKPNDQGDAQATDTTAVQQAMQWTGSYADTLPCADCPGIFTELQLRADSTYVLRQLYLERDSIPYGTIGQWTVEGDRLTLHTVGSDMRWLAQDGGLRGIDEEGDVIDSPLPYTLQRVGAVATGPMHLTGGYVYYADSHSFTPCGSPYMLPVAMDPADEPGAGLELERTYSKLALVNQQPLYVKVTATLQQGPAMEGDGTDEYLHIGALEGVLELQACN